MKKRLVHSHLFCMNKILLLIQFKWLQTSAPLSHMCCAKRNSVKRKYFNYRIQIMQMKIETDKMATYSNASGFLFIFQF